MWIINFILLVAGPLSVTAAPTLPYPGVSVPLSKRSSLVGEDGVVDTKALSRQLRRTASKIQRGFHAYHINTGSMHPNDMRGSGDLRRDTGSVPLIDDKHTLWHGGVSVGTPPVSFTVDFDTGSSDFFLPGDGCGITCNGHLAYDPSISLTAESLGKAFSLRFGDGSTVKGRQVADTVTISGLTATRQAIGTATQYSPGFRLNQFSPDGLMGMAFAQISNFKASPVFQTLMAQKQTTSPEFAFKLADSGSELSLGGVNNRLFRGPFTQNPVTHMGFWQIALDAVSANGEKIVSGRSAIIDTGTTLILGDEASVFKFYAAIPGSRELGSGFFSVPCNAIPEVSLTFGGRDFAISRKLFNLGLVSSGSANCIGGIATGADLTDFWVVGDIFLRNVYTSFDAGKRRVGFANLA